MASFWNGLYFIALLHFTEIFSNVMSENDDDAKEIYLCIMRQICECEGGEESYKRCFSFMKEETAQWVFEEANKCNIGTIASYEDLAGIGCSIPRDDFFPCFMDVERKMRKKTNELSKNPLKYDELTALYIDRYDLTFY
ncbi:uncharacterized protein LOC118187802 [Stegodyphus dumicola]|uniref:uncharacterized protein LOC118187802 n=1 Tax=Stegodyphus dumicola TaxID=202533 RepID=UPI0015B1EFB2|nr:uncharacterized protein LOC118187802 [Stegodyphus dumicola]